MTAFVPYVTFMKHAQKVTRATRKTRPVLSAVIHRDNYVAVTDSHRLYKADNLHEGDEKQVDPITGLDVDNGEYPEIERLISDSANAEFTHRVDALRAYEAIRAIEIASRISKIDTLCLTINDDFVQIETDDKAAFGVVYEEGTYKAAGSKGKAYLNIKYVKEALHVLKDAKVETFTLEYFGRNRPIHIRAGNFLALILPIRTTQ